MAALLQMTFGVCAALPPHDGTCRTDEPRCLVGAHRFTSHCGLSSAASPLRSALGALHSHACFSWNMYLLVCHELSSLL